ncbi:MAG: murE [Acidimicrobiaceae bacterium]|nr:murE [Acidimicrobiaceae bacterium]
MDRSDERVPLGEIIERVRPLAVLGEHPGDEVSGISIDSRQTRPGALFCCLPGEHADGHAFAGAARAAGASAFVCEHSLGPVAEGAAQLVVGAGEARVATARAAAAFYRDPASSLHCVGVTGTNGKTTTTFLLRSIFNRHGWRAGVIGTLGGARTTPEAPDLQRALARERASGASACAIEVTSHALVQHRVDEVVFEVAVFTNLSQDHLDYHHSMEAYFQAKARLFTPEHARVAVICADDLYGRRLLERPAIDSVSFSLDDVRDLEVGVASSSFRLGGRLVRLRAGGLFNVRNALGAAASARVLGIPVDEIIAGLESADPVPGRFEAIETAEGVTVIVDYAHTPAGLEEALSAARRSAPVAPRPQVPGRVIAVFGCGGDRDRGKRPVMGAVAARLADSVLITTDNPRSEDPVAIAAAVLAGAGGSGRVRVELDRRQAIAEAVGEARPGDVVVVAGKGHEVTQQFASEERPFDDRRVVREELVRRGLTLRHSARPEGRSA